MTTVNGYFLLFCYSTQPHRATKAQSMRPHKKDTLTLLCAKDFFLNNCFENSH